MATITKSIGTSSRDYSTITAWEADLDNSGVYASGDTAVGECYNDSAFDEGPTINGGTTVGLAAVNLSVASGQRHTGTAGTGARIVRGGAANGLTLGVNGLTAEWLEYSANGFGSAAMVTGTARNGCIVQRVIAHDTVRASGCIGIQLTPGTGTGVNINNCVVYDVNDTGTGASAATGISTGAEGARTAQVHNCTVERVVNDGGTGTAIGINLADGTGHKARNCIACTTGGTTSGTIADFDPASPVSATMEYNLSSDTTASGTGSLTSKSAANQFVSTTNGSEDYHLKSGADAIDTGTDLGTTPTGVNYDIDNRDRDAQGDTWDIGADEYVAAGGTQYYVIGGGVSGASGVIVGII